ncbi:MAG: lysophospholipid acyltransferase family protein [Saprospiraceae bacterium]|nr:lysophospholipid acyltransferase family protein [Saprospiraceae bacterium]
MKRFRYHLLVLWMNLFALIPFWMLYLMSDFLFFIFYRLLKYRYRVVMENLSKSFPEKSPEEIRRIARGFYKNLSDITLETIKGFTLSQEAFLKRHRFVGMELLEKDFYQGQSAILGGVHFANWEWGLFCIALVMKHQMVAVYKPINTKAVDDYFNNRRSRWGVRLAAMNQVGRAIAQYKNEPCAFLFIADQSPSDVQNAHWIEFMHQDTPFLPGIDKIARRTNYPVFYCDLQRVKRGYYELTLSELCRDSSQFQEGEITKLFAKKLEASIRANPSDWLWSHKRWKRKKLE